LDEVPENVRTKLLNDKEAAFFSKRMATIVLDVPMKLNLEDCKTHTYDQEKVTNYFQELEFKSLLGKLGRVDNHYNGQREKELNSQQSLF
jgi:DNA polymerase-1